MFTVETDLDRDLVKALRPKHFPYGVDEILASLILRKARNLVDHCDWHPAYAVDVAARRVNMPERRRSRHLTYKVGKR